MIRVVYSTSEGGKIVNGTGVVFGVVTRGGGERVIVGDDKTGEVLSLSLLQVRYNPDRRS